MTEHKYEDIVERALGQGGNGIINLSYNRITSQGAADLAGALERSHHLTHLKVLYLNSNLIDDEGVAALARALAMPHLTNLTRLDLHSNWIGDEGAAALADALERSPHLGSLTRLSLSFNSITYKGATALARALTKSHLSELNVLNLSGNDVGTKGAVAFSDAFERSPHLGKLKELVLCGNAIGNDMYKRVRGAWQRGEDRRHRMAALFGTVEASSELRNTPALDYNAFTLVAPYL